jgi:hypothetical protein
MTGKAALGSGESFKTHIYHYVEATSLSRDLEQWEKCPEAPPFQRQVAI